MGTKGSRLSGDERLDVLYTSSLKMDDLKVIQAELQKLNIHLSQWQSWKTGPVLILQDAAKENTDSLVAASRRLEKNQMMVALSSKEARLMPGEQLVQMKFSRSWGGFRSKTLDLHSSGKNLECAKVILTFLQDEKRLRSESKTRGGEMDIDIPKTGSSTDPSVYRTDESYGHQAAKSSEHQAGDAKPYPKTSVAVAFDRDPDWLMDKAVAFLKEECSLELRPARNLHKESPLLVMCKNSTKLQEDIDYAKNKTRAGKDVMLFVVTDRPEQTLADTPATEGFGAKARLLWDHQRGKFGGKDNQTSLFWLRKFMQRFGYNLHVKLSRGDSLKRSFRGWTKTEVSGCYYAVQPLEEELEKNTIVYLGSQLIELKKATETNDGSGEIVLIFNTAEMKYKEALRRFKQQMTGQSVLLSVGLCPSYLKPFESDPQLRYLVVDDSRQDRLDIGENGEVADHLRRLLKKSSRKSGKTKTPSQPERAADAGDEPMAIDAGEERMEEGDLNASGGSQGFHARESASEEAGSGQGPCKSYVEEQKEHSTGQAQWSAASVPSPSQWSAASLPPRVLVGAASQQSAGSTLSGMDPYQQSLTVSSVRGMGAHEGGRSHPSSQPLQQPYHDETSVPSQSVYKTQQNETSGRFFSNSQHGFQQNETSGRFSSNSQHEFQQSVASGRPRGIQESESFQNCQQEVGSRGPSHFLPSSPGSPQAMFPAGPRQLAISSRMPVTETASGSTEARYTHRASNEPHAAYIASRRSRDDIDTRGISLTGHGLQSGAQETQSEFYPMHQTTDTPSMRVSLGAHSADRRPHRQAHSLPGRRRVKEQPSRVTIIPNAQEGAARQTGTKRQADESLNDVLTQLGNLTIDGEKKAHVIQTQPAPPPPRARRRTQPRSRR